MSAVEVIETGWPQRTGRPRGGTICQRCEERPVAVEVIAQARGTARTKPMRYYGTRSRRVCEPCGQELFAAMLGAMEVQA